MHGASLAAQRPVLVADLTGQHAAGLLMSLCEQAGTSGVAYRLPAGLGTCGILSDLSAGQLADAVAEAIHAGAPGGARTGRAVDVRVLSQLAGALTPHEVTAQRLVAAVRVALGQHAPDGSPGGGTLSAQERDVIGGEIFPPSYREAVAPSLVRLDAVLPGLAASSGPAWPARPARCTCLAMDAGARSASGEVLAALVAQWLTAQAAEPGTGLPAVIVSGADEITRAHAERLADACELRGAPLTLLIRHLRDDAITLLGGGTTAFMRLGNRHEAEQAAGYLGREHIRPGESSGGKTRTSGTSASRNRGTPWSLADGSSWTDAATRQRVHEYRVEPSVLQNLPEHALLLADRWQSALRLRAVECDPSIAALPGASAGPQPPGLPPLDDIP